MIVLPFVIAAVAIAIIASFKKSKEFFPLGPRGIPFLGSLIKLALGGAVHLQLAQWAVKYGKMYSLYIARQPILVVNDIKLLKNLLGRTEATGRIPPELFSMLFWSGRHGMFNTGDSEWLEQRQFFVKTFIKFGFGRETRIESQALSEADKLCKWMDNNRGADNKLLLNQAVIHCTNNLMWAMLTGKTTEKMQPPKVFELVPEWFTYSLKLYKWGKMNLFRNIAPVHSGYNEVQNLCNEIQECIELQFKEHSETRVAGEPPRDIIDAYIEKVENCRDTASTLFGETGMKHSFSSVLQFIVAGADSPAIIITWILFYLTVEREAQEKLQQEIDSVIGRYRAPALEDKKSMPYIQAVILEGLRCSSAVPVGGRVTLLEDVKIDGYQIPKGTLVLSNLYFVNHDKTIWGDPENFRPERFLEKGNEHLKDMMVSFQPFSKRSCPGAYFARDILFLFVAKLFQSFTFSVDPGIENAKKYFEQIPGLIRKPKELALVVTNRK